MGEVVEIAKGYRIAVGTPLQIRIEGIDFTFNSTFEGVADGGHLLIEFDPHMRLFQTRLKPGDYFSAHYLSEDDVYHLFKARFDGLTTGLPTQVILQHPQEVMNIERRSMKRLDCTVEARVEIRKNLEVHLRDINQKGCRLVADLAHHDIAYLSPSDRVRLRLRAPEGQHGYIVEGQVRNVVVRDDKLEAGVLFDTLPETLRTFIDSLAGSASLEI
jgi:hypothetical protein